MSIISIPYTFSAGAVIIASQHNSNFSTIYSDYNGNIDNTNIVANAGIIYSKLILTGNIVNADINSSAGIIGSKLDLTSPGPIGSTSANTGAFTTFKLGTTHQGDVLYDNGTSIIRLTPGTSGQFLQTLGASSNPQWASIVSRTMLGVNASFLSSATSYSCPSDSIAASGTLANHQFVIPYGGTIKNLYISTPNTSSGTMAITVYKSLSVQTLTATVGSTNTTANDTTHSFTVVAGDTINFENINGRTGVVITSISVELDG